MHTVVVLSANLPLFRLLYGGHLLYMIFGLLIAFLFVTLVLKYESINTRWLWKFFFNTVLFLKGCYSFAV